MSQAIRKLKTLFDEQDKEKEDNEENNTNEGENIAVKGMKQKVRNNLSNLSILQNKLKKYEGKDISYEQLKERESDSENETNEKWENTNNIPVKNVEENKQSTTTLKQSMDKQDEEFLKSLKQSTPNQIKKAINVENQNSIYDSLIGTRISLQKFLSAINTLPCSKSFNLFFNDETIKAYQRSFDSFQKLQNTFVKFHEKVIYNSNLQYSSLTSSSSIDHSSGSSLRLLTEKIANTWYRKSLVNSFQSNNKKLKILNDNFCQHIKTNVNANLNSLKIKTHKTTNDHLLGRKRQSSNEDSEIYNDLDFYNFLLKEFIINNEKDISNNNTNENRYDLTLQFLLNKKKQSKKKVDTKSSKNRRMRFNKHEHLINFMIPRKNSVNIQGRDIIVASLFGAKQKSKEEKDEEAGDLLII